jgi:hypothetical protein
MEEGLEVDGIGWNSDYTARRGNVLGGGTDSGAGNRADMGHSMLCPYRIEIVLVATPGIRISVVR